MKRLIRFFFFSAILLLCFDKNAYAGISPLKIDDSGAAPVSESRVKVDSADITVSPNGDQFLFSCKYVLIGSENIDSLTIGIPGDLGYTLEAGYINDMSITVNGQPVEYKIYDTPEQSVSPVMNPKTSMHFKWYTFTIPITEGTPANINATYNISWRIFEQNSNSTYYIIPFMLTPDKLFGDSMGKYKITYINDDHISPPGIKVMISSMLEADIISPAILNPQYGGDRITWEFSDGKDFQDFRLVVLSARKTAIDFFLGTQKENSVRWALLNNNYSKLATMFEEVTKNPDYIDDDKGNAAFLSSEFYFRIGDFDKALSMLSLPYKTTIWPSSIMYDYVNAVKLKASGEYDAFLVELKKMAGLKDYILLSSYVNTEMKPAIDILASQANYVRDKENKTNENGETNWKYIFIPLGILLFLIILFIIIKITSGRKKKKFW